MEGVHILSHESAAEILTPKRRDLITYLAENEVASVRDLARGCHRRVLTP
ncbi:HVO_A0114 family putative DNA-binding protein [Haladaptatus sp. NG-WS-4]